MTAPEDIGLHTLIKDLEREICFRLDRVESSLQRLTVQQRAAPAEDTAPESEHLDSESVEQELPSNIQAESSAVKTTAVAAAPPPPHHSASGSIGPHSASAPLCLRPEWQDWNSAEADPSTAALVYARINTVDVSTVDNSEVTPAGNPWWIIMPNKTFRLCWDALMGLIILHDMAVVPLTLAFKTGGNLVTDALFWPFLAFWTIDLPLNFFTGLNRNGHVEVRMAQIACSYFRTWFIIDAVVLGSTWTEVVVNAGYDEFLLGRMGKTLRFLRVLRALRFLRFAKLLRITEELSDHVMSEYNHIAITVTKLLLSIIWLNHFIACTWWALGTNMSEAGFDTTWTSEYKLETAPLVSQYFTALHWSLTQFTPAGMEVHACNTPERIFSVLILLFAMITFGSIVSSITAAMTQLRRLQGSTAENFFVLRRYLRSRNLPLDLTARILRCVEHRLAQQRKQVQEGEVQFLQLISQPLRMELATRISGPILTGHPFLRRYSEVGFEAMRHVCLEALSRCALSTKDALFDEAEPCEKMYFLVSGLLRYAVLKPGDEGEAELATGPADGLMDQVLALNEGESCCEVGMWCPWVHCGTMTAGRMSNVLALDVAAFTRITCSFRTVNRFTARYAKIFLHRTRRSSSLGTFIGDLSVFDAAALDEMVEHVASEVYVHSDDDMQNGDGGASQPAEAHSHFSL